MQCIGSHNTTECVVISFLSATIKISIWDDGSGEYLGGVLVDTGKESLIGARRIAARLNSPGKGPEQNMD